VSGVGCRDRSREMSRDYLKGQGKSRGTSRDLSGNKRRLHKLTRLGIKQDTTCDLEDV